MDPVEKTSSAKKTAIIVALIALMGTVVTAVISNWDKIVNAPPPSSGTISNASPSSNTPSNPTSIPISSTSSTPSVDYKNLAIDLANRWYSDVKDNNIDDLLNIVTVPFYADNKILSTLPEVREFYRSINGDRPKTIPNLSELKIFKASELQAKGFDLTHDRFFSSLNLEPDPYVAMLGFDRENGHKEYVEVIFRTEEKGLKIAGVWD